MQDFLKMGGFNRAQHECKRQKNEVSATFMFLNGYRLKKRRGFSPSNHYQFTGGKLL